MIPELRADFNARYTPEKYRDFLSRLTAACGMEVPFRNSETPCFFARELLDRTADAGSDLIHQLVDNPEYLAAADGVIPPEYRAPHDTARPLFVQADFGLALDDGGTVEPKLVEIQAFPSLYAYQSTLARVYAEAYKLDSNLQFLLGGITEDAYNQSLRQAVLGNCDPENVILLEIDPWHQKTAADFTLTERICGIKTVDFARVRKQGRRLYYDSAGRRIPIERIYNRAIVDELVRKNIASEFGFRDDVDVEWAGHPNWFYRISKFSLPFLRHPSVPKCWFLNEMKEFPDDLQNYVLKPLFSFAGRGVTIGPSRSDLEAVPRIQRSAYLLQERVDFKPVIATPRGPTKAEIRIMYIWNETLKPVTTIIRMGRGKMMGVDQNRDMEWVGASAGFVAPL